MTLEQIKNRVYDYKTVSRWALVKTTPRRNRKTGELNPQTRLRVVGIGRKYIRLMHADGRIVKYDPVNIDIAF